MEVRVAKREKIKVPIMITGASGSGKTISSLLIAKGIVEEIYPELPQEEQWLKIGMIDSEHKRSLLYADSEIGGIEIGEFLHVDLEAPFTVERYNQAFALLKKEQVEVVIVDSLTHAWSGEGGILEQVESIQKNNAKMQMVAWNRVKPLEKKFLKLITGNSVYVIGTARSKQAYSTDKNDQGKTQFVKLGLKPDQKDTLEYEFAISLRLDQDHVAEANKDNSNMFNSPFKITKETGKAIYRWSDSGVDLKAYRESLINKITELSSTSKKHNDVFIELHKRVFNEPLNNVKLTLLEQMEKILLSVKQPLKEQEKFSDDKNPPQEVKHGTTQDV